MEELLKDFLVETAENVEAAASQLVQFERDPGDPRIIGNIFRLVHTIKGTCGFIGLPRLAQLAHAAESLIGRLRDGASATPQVVSLVLEAVDRIKLILDALERTDAEPQGDDATLIEALNAQTTVVAAPPPPAIEPCAIEPPPLVDTRIGPVERRGAPKDGQRRPETIRVAVDVLERMMTLISELVLTRNQLVEQARRVSGDQMKAPLQRLSALTTDLQDGVMRARMQPMSRLFANLPRLARELRAQLGKDFELLTEGSDTELDRQLIELIRDPLTHIIRNCADHGLEPPETRRLAGKPPVGAIRVRAAQEAGQIVIEIADDGRGLDVERISALALSRGLVSEAELARLSTDEICRFIFAPGFSTADAVTSVSGRGVGMDVVRENIDSIGGAVTLATTPGRGATFTLKIPLTLAIAPALIVEIGVHRFALPQHTVVEAVAVGPTLDAKVESLQNALVLRLRDQVLPVADLRAILQIGPRYDCASDGLIVVMRVGAASFGIMVDSVADVQEIVVKPLGWPLAHLAVFSGKTILGDGGVVLILDPAGLAAAVELSETNIHQAAAVAPEVYAPPVEMTRLILFRAGVGALKALPLSFVTRIESVEPGAIEHSDGGLVMEHLGRLMPVLPAAPDIDFRDKARPVLVVAVGGEPMGLLVSEILDIFEDTLDVHIAGAASGVVGSANIRGRAVEIIDVAHYMKLARPNAFARGHGQRRRILLVDDKLFFRDMLSPVIAAAGYLVNTAASAREGLALMAKGVVFDAVVTDIDMPEIDGYAFAQMILAEPARRDIPILALAAYADPNVQRAADVAGIRAVTGKFDRAALLRALDVLMTTVPLGATVLESRFMTGAAA